MSDCTLWTGPVDRDGYGKTGGRLAHRVIYESLNGPVPEGLELDHLCRVRRCVNPDHLEAVTHAVNVERSLRAECAAGHDFTPENTYRRPSGGRQCRTCNRDAVRRYKQRRAAAA